MTVAGTYLAFSGADGVGKSTIATAVTEAARSDGLEVSQTSWKLMMKEGVRASMMAELYRATLILMFSTTADEAVALQIADDTQNTDRTAFELDTCLSQFDNVRQSSAAGFYAAAAIELGGNLWLHHEAQETAYQTDLVVNDSWGLKHCFKELWLGALIANEQVVEYESVMDSLLGKLIESMFNSVLRPTIGIHVHCSPELAWERRLAEGSPIGCFEDGRLAGIYGKQGWMTMHTATADYLLSFAQRAGWPVIDTSETPVEDSVELIREHIARYST